MTGESYGAFGGVNSGVGMCVLKEGGFPFLFFFNFLFLIFASRSCSLPFLYFCPLVLLSSRLTVLLLVQGNTAGRKRDRIRVVCVVCGVCYFGG